MENEYIIKTEKLSFAYDDESGQSIPALREVSLSIKKGEYIAVLGHNGSGKSTLAKLMNLILTPTSGKIFIDGLDVTSEDFSEDDLFKIRSKVGMVFQNPDNQLVATVVEEDVAFGPENLGLPREEIRRRVTESLNLVDMQEYAHHAPHKLSGGQKQRVAIAGIIAMRPKVIIFDESTAMLDPLGRQDVIKIMESLNKEGITVINITHYMQEAARAQRVVIINDGKLIIDGTPNQVFTRVDELHAIGLEAPQGTELLHLLKKNGIKTDADGVSEEACVAALMRLLK